MADNSKDRNFIGTGWSFPPQFDIMSKSVIMTTDEADIKNSLSILMSTVVGERVMDMDYGCNMDALVFENLDTSTITFIKSKIEKAILFFESRIELKSVNLNTDSILEGLILIELEYIISSTNSRFNFVYPFWKEEGTELQSIVRFNK